MNPFLQQILDAIKADPKNAIHIVKAALPGLRLFAPMLVALIPATKRPTLAYVKANPGDVLDFLEGAIALLEKHPKLVAALLEEYGGVKPA